MRAVNDLTNGHFLAAFWSNALFVSTIPLFVLWWLVTMRDRWRGNCRPWIWPLERAGVMPTVLIVMVIFTVVRNTPWGARLYP